MPVVAGVLLSLALVVWLAGFHLGPHAHVIAAAVALVGAGWLVIAILDGRSAPALWAVVAAVVVISSVAALTATLAISGRGTIDYDPHRIEGREALVVDDLAPDGRVRVRGEVWAATAVNGVARTGTRVQVLRVTALHLEVWAEEPDPSVDEM